MSVAIFVRRKSRWDTIFIGILRAAAPAISQMLSDEEDPLKIRILHSAAAVNWPNFPFGSSCENDMIGKINFDSEVTNHAKDGRCLYSTGVRSMSQRGRVSISKGR